MKNLVAEAIGRTLRISSNRIISWSLQAEQPNRGTLKTRLQVSIIAEREDLQWLQHAYMVEERRGSWALQEVSISSRAPFSDPANLDVTLLYGKETQHIFKALAQTMVYRRNQKSRK